MNFDDLRKTYSEHELSYFPGDNELRFRAFAPYLENLYESRLVYWGRQMWIVCVHDLRITPEGFSATAVPEHYINLPRYREPEKMPEPWRFAAEWRWIRLLNHSLNMPYCGWTIWPEPSRVQAVVQCIESGLPKQALDLTYYDGKPLSREFDSKFR